MSLKSVADPSGAHLTHPLLEYLFLNSFALVMEKAWNEILYNLVVYDVHYYVIMNDKI